MENDKIKKLLEQKKDLEKRIRREQNRNRAKARKDDTRRKILAGAWVLDEASQREDFKQFVYGKLDSFLTKPADRALFGLTPSKKEEGQ